MSHGAGTPPPQIMVTSPEMADYLNRALDMLRRGESIDGFGEKHKAEWKRREAARARALAKSPDEITDADVLPFFNPNKPVEG